MYKIGAFSNITQLTVKALRYYHDEGLLDPKEIDKITNYRLYTADQIPLARAIKLLRVCEFSIKEIKEIIHECDDLEDLPYFMDEKIGKINTDIQHLFNAKQRLEEERNKRKVVMNLNKYKINVKTFNTIDVISTKYIGRYDECGPYFGKLHKHAKGNAKGIPFNLYYDLEFKEDASIEVCLPVKKKMDGTNEILCKNLPEVKGISVVHIGPYDTIGEAYQSLIDYALKNNHELELPMRETYLKGPGILFMGNPNKYETEVFIPFK